MGRFLTCLWGGLRTACIDSADSFAACLVFRVFTALPICPAMRQTEKAGKVHYATGATW